MSLPRLGLRSSGLLVHPTSLPGPHGSGDLGVSARGWLDFVRASGQRWWQMLPVGPTGYGNSPYSAQSAFAGSALLLALEPLVERGWVRRKRSEEDRRQYVLELSAAGQRVRDRVEAAREGIIEQMATVLDKRDFEDFDRIAGKILAVFGEPPDDSNAR